MRISEIAKKAGVSSMVVSRVIQGSPTVKRQDKDRVQRVLRDIHLEHAFITTKRSKRSIVFGLVIPRFEDIFHSFYATEVIKGVFMAASRLKLDIMVHITEINMHEDWLTSASLSSEYIDGILFADINGDRDQLKKVISRKIPCIVLNNYFDKEPINCVAIDNEKAAYGVCEYLLKLNHKRIATIAGDISTQAGNKRLDGFKVCLKENKINVSNKYITIGHFMRSPARSAMNDLLKLSKPPTAVFAASDVMAMEAIDVIRSKGLSVPEDISVIGFDDNPLNAYSPIALTTVWQPIAEMGRLGVEFLHQIVSQKIRQPVKRLLQTKLVKRDSCKEL